MSDWTSLGPVLDIDGNEIEVKLHASGAVALEREWVQSAIVIPPAERDKLAELLQRAAMPGQPAAEADRG